MWQVQVVHQVDKFLPALCEPWVAALLSPYAAHAATLVVVTRQHQGVLWEAEELGVDVVVQQTCRASSTNKALA